MAYYTGTDVKVWVCTEHAFQGIKLGSDGASGAKLVSTETAGDFTAGSATIAPMGLADKGLGQADFNISDITGVDVTIGAQDEDISYFGTKTPGKIETKADCNVTITRKKSTRLWSTLVQGLTEDSSSYAAVGNHAGRHGMIKDASTAHIRIADGTVDPKSTKDAQSNVCYGYRVAIQLKDATGTGPDGSNKDGTVLVLRNCTLGDYTVTMSNDSANEESFTLSTMVKPLIGNGLHHDGNGNFHGLVAETLEADM
jgi:hypothetical protein